MDTVLAIVVVAVIAWVFIAKRKHDRNPGSGGLAGKVASDVAARSSTSTRVGQPPSGTQIESWSAQLRQQEVVGESKYAHSFQQLLVDYGKRGADRAEFDDVRAVLSHEPENRYDSNAVAVWIDGRRLVGYLPRDAAARYASVLESLSRDGKVLRVPARVWISRDPHDSVSPIFASARVWIPEPEGVVAYNDLPDEPYVVLPHGKAVQVTGEEHHMDVLTTFNLGRGERHVAATLHVVSEQKTERSANVEVVEVRLDGRRIGVLTKGMSEQLRDLVRFVAETGKTPVCRAVIKGTQLRADVTLYVARTVDVPQRWLDAI